MIHYITHYHTIRTIHSCWCFTSTKLCRPCSVPREWWGTAANMSNDGDTYWSLSVVIVNLLWILFCLVLVILKQRYSPLKSYWECNILAAFLSQYPPMATNRPPRPLKICKAWERSHSGGAAATAADCKNGSVSDFCRFVLQHSVVVIHLAYMQWFTSESVVCSASNRLISHLRHY